MAPRPVEIPINDRPAHVDILGAVGGIGNAATTAQPDPTFTNEPQTSGDPDQSAVPAQMVTLRDACAYGGVIRSDGTRSATVSECDSDFVPRLMGTRNLDKKRPAWARYQELVTGRYGEEVWGFGERSSQVDGGPHPFVVEAKWTLDDGQFDSSPYSPAHISYRDGNRKERTIVDQARRLLDLNNRLGGRGVRYAVSSREGADFFRALLREWYPDEVAAGVLAVYHVPAYGMPSK